MLIFQDLAQVRDESLIQDLLTNTGLKIVLGGIGDADSIRFSRVFGSRERLFRTQTASSGRGVGQSHSSGSHQGAGSHQRGGSQSRQQSVSWGRAPRLRAEFTATELRELPDHHAVIERRDQQGHLTTATLVHFDADLQRLLTRQQRLTLWGPDAEPLNHLHPFFPQRPAPQPAPAPAPPAPSHEARAAQPAPTGPGDGTAPVGGAPSATSPAPAPETLAPTAPPLAAPPPAAVPPPRRRITIPLSATDLPVRLTGGGAGWEPSTGSALNDAPSGPVSPLAPPAPPTLVQAALPFAGLADRSPGAALPAGRPAAAEPQPPPEPVGDPPLDPAEAVPLLIKQLGVDAAAASFLATAAARQGYTAAQFAALLAQVCAAPDTVHPYGVLYARVTQPAPTATPEVR